MDKTLSEYKREIVSYISQTFPNLQFRGSADIKLLERWYYLGIPHTFILKYVTEMEDNPPKSLKELQEVIERRFKADKKKEKEHLNMLFKSYSSPQERLRYLYDILQAILISISVDNVLILEKLKELENCDVETVEVELERFEELFYKFLFEHSRDKDEILLEAVKELEPYRFYWDEKIYKMTLKALIKKLLKERYEIPDFTTVISS
ncbi:hypothetical protein [Desulfurobacterium atlanticum]|uniref:Uncharacterized protein n=1 Tax=Desulfurobacterium atlanticum TaxID=240169 RepID=A0A238XS81_9BACT|nr:hypothetical protein [Desulfurobacterium atlanticum]SNR61787.1 hypothetical protein SAMN06265340_101226 [Desulfurobacterium atlanticum]